MQDVTGAVMKRSKVAGVGAALTGLLAGCGGHGGVPADVLSACHDAVTSNFPTADGHFYSETIGRGQYDLSGTNIHTYEISGKTDATLPYVGEQTIPYKCTVDPRGILIDESVDGVHG